MNSLQQIKLTSYMNNQKSTAASIARSIAALNNDLSAALEHQAYARNNPDGVIDADLLAVIDFSVDLLLSQYAEVDDKRKDLLAVRGGSMPVSDTIYKYNMDLTKYSSELI